MDIKKIDIHPTMEHTVGWHHTWSHMFCPYETWTFITSKDGPKRRSTCVVKYRLFVGVSNFFSKTSCGTPVKVAPCDGVWVHPPPQQVFTDPLQVKVLRCQKKSDKWWEICSSANSGSSQHFNRSTLVLSWMDCTLFTHLPANDFLPPFFLHARNSLPSQNLFFSGLALFSHSTPPCFE
jgi:hypothetical protein